MATVMCTLAILVKITEKGVRPLATHFTSLEIIEKNESLIVS
jgi:hypothetical protein